MQNQALRALNEEKQGSSDDDQVDLDYQSIVIKKEKFEDHLGFSKPHSFEEIYNIDPKTILIQGGKRLLLIDKQSGGVVDSQVYRRGFWTWKTHFKIDKDIVAVLSPEKGFVDIYQVVLADPESDTDNSRLILKQIDCLGIDAEPRLHSVRGLMAVNKIEEKGIVQVCLLAQIYTDESKIEFDREILIAEKRILEPHQGVDSGRDQNEEVIKIEARGKWLPVFRDLDGWTFHWTEAMTFMSVKSHKSFIKDNVLYHSFFDRDCVICLKFELMPQRALQMRCFCDLMDEALNLDRREILGHFHEGNHLYLTLRRVEDFYDQNEDIPAKELLIVEISAENSDDLEHKIYNGFSIQKSFTLHDSAEVFYDHKCEKVRMFVYTQIPAGEEDQEGMELEGALGEESVTRSVLTVYDDRLEKVTEIDLSGFEIKIRSEKHFHVIDEERVFMVVKRLQDGKFLSFVLNIKEKNLTEIVGDGEAKWDIGILGCVGDRLMLVDIIGFDEGKCTSDAVYFSGKL